MTKIACVACAKWSLIAGTIAYAIMLWQAGSTLSADHMLMVGAIIGAMGFCFAADYYGSRLPSLQAFTLSVLAGFVVFLPFSIIRLCRIVLYLCDQLPHSQSLSPNGFGFPWEFVLMGIAFLAWVGNMCISPLKQETSHPYANVVTITVLASLFGVPAMMDAMLIWDCTYSQFSVVMTIVTILVILTVLYRLPSLWDQEHGGIIGALIGFGIPFMTWMIHVL